jgi:oligosaccharide repeat unit polymerase
MMRNTVIDPKRNLAASTAMMLCGLALTSIILPSDSAVNVFQLAAFIVGASLALATTIEGTVGISNLLRTDLLIIWVLYWLTLFEFLFPQPGVDDLLTAEAAVAGTHAVLVGFAGLVVGRHISFGRRGAKHPIPVERGRQPNVFVLFLVVSIIGYLHMLVAVNFDPTEMLRQMALPRFSQSWARGQFGDAYSLLYELGLLIQTIPPIAACIYARPRDYNLLQKTIVSVILITTLYYGVSSGTRSVIAGYAITFVSAYFLMKPDMKTSRKLLLGGTIAVLCFITTVYMVEFRDRGLSNYTFSEERHYETLFVDLNIVNISRLTLLFPNSYDFLGFEIPFNALIRPIPRAWWPGKPEGLSTGIEEALGVRGMTLSATIVGEAYMAGGLFAVFLSGLLFGAGAAMWNGVARDVNSSRLLYASGLVCAAMSMRSMLQMVPLMLPTAALWLCFRYWSRQPSKARS